MAAFLGIVLAGAALALGSTRGAGSADEIHWTITGPRSVTVHWRAGEAAVRYGLTPKLGQAAPAAAPTPQPFSNPGPFREARLGGLEEDTVYYYSVGGPSMHTFRTPPRRGSSGFTFHVQGDIGNSHNWERVATLQSMIAAGRPRFVLCVGDLTYANAAGQRAVEDHFNDMMKWSRDAAYMPAWGNHEYDEPQDDDLRNYKGRFDLPNPQASPSDSRYPHTGGGEDWYWFDYGNVRFIAYPEPWSGAWPDWSEKVRPVMEQAQRDSAIEFIVTFGHQPAYSSGYHAGEPKLQEMLGSLALRYGKYALNLNGHSHNYERSHPQHGVVHVTAGTGGSDLEETSDPRCLWKGGCPPPAWSAFRAMHHVVVEIRAAAGRIDGRVLCGPAGDHDDNQNDRACPRGSTIDSFTILPRDPTQGPRGAAGGPRRSGL